MRLSRISSDAKLLSYKKTSLNYSFEILWPEVFLSPFFFHSELLTMQHTYEKLHGPHRGKTRAQRDSGVAVRNGAFCMFVRQEPAEIQLPCCVGSAHIRMSFLFRALGEGIALTEGKVQRQELRPRIYF